MSTPWVDLFEMTELRGRGRRVFGPSSLVWFDAVAWAGAIQSIASGPETYVRLCEAVRPTETIGWLPPNSIINVLADLPEGRRINAIQILSAPPTPGMSGYEMFAAHFATPANGH